MIVAFGSVLGLGVQLALTVALCWWGARVGRARGGWWRHLVWTPLAAAFLGALGLALTVLGLVQAFGAVDGVSAEHKAQVLAEGISNAMNATMVFEPMSLLLYLGSALACLVGSFVTSRPEQR